MDQKDVPIETAVVLGDTGEPIAEPEKLTILGLLEQMKKANRPFEAEHYRVAKNNERFIHGKQIVGRKEDDPFVVDEGLAWPQWLPPITRNIMRNLSLTKRSQMIKDTPSTKAWPGEAGPSDPMAAEVADAVLAYYKHKFNWPNMLAQASAACEAHGCVGFRQVWDPQAGPRSVDGEPLGDVIREVVTCFDFGMSASTVEDSEWLFFRRWYTRERARAMLLDAGITEQPDVSERDSAWANEREECVEAFEIWYLPTSHRVPKGLHAIVIGGHVTMQEDFPYDHGELCFGVWYCDEKSGWPYGDTHVTDACPVQANINRLEAAKTSVLARTAQWMKLLVPKAIFDAINGGQQIIPYEPSLDVSGIKIITVDNAPTKELDSQIGKEEQKLMDVYGINEAVLGSDASATKNARHLAYVSELDQQKNAITRRSLNACNVRMDQQLLRLIQQYVDDTRMARIVGPNGLQKIVAFRGADVAGIDVILEAAPGSDQTRAAKAKEAEELAAAQLLDPMAAAERRATGLGETLAENDAASVVLEQVQEAIAGGMPEPDSRVPLPVAERVILLAIDQLDGDPTAMLELLDAYREIAAQAMAAPEQGQVKPVGGESTSADALPEVQ